MNDEMAEIHLGFFAMLKLLTILFSLH